MAAQALTPEAAADRRGKQDPGYYAYWAYRNRPRITWPGGARVAFWVAPISSSTNWTRR